MKVLIKDFLEVVKFIVGGYMNISEIRKENEIIDIFCNLKFIKMLTVLTFPFFIWQPVGQKITKDLIKAFSLNDYSFLLLFIITLALSVFAYIIIDIIPKCIKNVLRGEKND